MTSLTTRMIPVNASGGTVSGFAGASSQDPGRRVYSANNGQFIDATGGPDADAAVLTSQGFLLVAVSGSTALRNSLVTYFKPGTLFADTTLNRLIMFDGLNWRDPMTGNVV
jgi:hypothetical protein